MAIGDDRATAIGQLLDRSGKLIGRIPHVQAGTDTLQGRLLHDLPRQTAGLVGGQRIHRVKDDGLDAGLTPFTLLAAVLQNGIKKALGLARARTGGHQCGAGVLTTQTGKGPALMGVRHETRRQPRKGRLTVNRRRLWAKRQRQRQIRAAEQVTVALDEAVDEAVKTR